MHPFDGADYCAQLLSFSALIGTIKRLDASDVRVIGPLFMLSRSTTVRHARAADQESSS